MTTDFQQADTEALSLAEAAVLAIMTALTVLILVLGAGELEREVSFVAVALLVLGAICLVFTLKLLITTLVNTLKSLINDN